MSTNVFEEIALAESAWILTIGGYSPPNLAEGSHRAGCSASTTNNTTPAIIQALQETKRLMVEIDQSIEQQGGWPLS